MANAIPTPISLMKMICDVEKATMVGHSFGSVLAFVVAGRLQRRGRPPAGLVAVAGVAPARWREHLARVAAADREDYVRRRTAELIADGALPGGIAGHPELQAAARHPFDPDPVACPITVVRARDDGVVGPDAVAGCGRPAPPGRSG
jgi:surfactin synthase thioesterase subunit